MEATRKKVAVVMPIRNEEELSGRRWMRSSRRRGCRTKSSSRTGCRRIPVAAIQRYGDRGVPIRVVSNPTIRRCGGGRNAAIR